MYHQKALRDITKLKEEAQKKHDEINRELKEKTDEVIHKAQDSVMGLDQKSSPK